MPRAADLEVGKPLEPRVVDPVRPEPMKTVAAILGDPNPIHYDTGAVRALGLGDRPINQGPINLGYLTEMVIRFAGDAQALGRIRVRFLGNVFAGERVECTGTVVAVDHDARWAELELHATSNGRPVLSGSATVLLD